MELIIIIVIVVIVLKMKSNATKKKEKQMAEQSRRELEKQYSAILKTISQRPANIVGCKDGTVYAITGNGLGRVIGSYKKESNGDLKVYSIDPFEIGNVHKSYDGEYSIYLTLHGKYGKYPHLRTRAFSSEHGGYWFAAKALKSVNAIIDNDTTSPIVWCEGNIDEAATAFICLTYEQSEMMGSGNKYSDFYRI